MNITEISLVQTRLNALIKQPLTQVSRETDMLLLHFGSRWTMRIQCYYRLTEQGRTILARNDVYQPSEAMWSLWRSLGYEEDYIPEDFHSDEPGANRMDEAIERLNTDLDGNELLLSDVLGTDTDAVYGNPDYLIGQYELILDQNGNIFRLPSDYELVGYSDGVLPTSRLKILQKYRQFV